MARTITVKGLGKVSAKPDQVVLSMTLTSERKDYDKAMSMAADSIQHLSDVLCGIGFEKSSVKTTSFNVNTDYDRVKDRNGNYERVFRGYEVVHRLKLSFDLDVGRLSQALSAVAGCLSHPQLSIAFTVKDATAINEEMLRSAAANAKRKAEILCDASGVTLGDLAAIDYNWSELDIYSHTKYDYCEDALMELPVGAPIEMEPDDIDVSDTATFVWEIR